jgi:hypothetical protein
MDLKSILLIHVFTTFCMTGICWFVQIIHYPLFHEISSKDFPNYEQKNYRTTYLTVPVMIVELFTGIYLLFNAYADLFLYNMILLFFIELSTILFQIPIQISLSKKGSSIMISKLVYTNWIRTILWSVRCIILVIILYVN